MTRKHRYLISAAVLAVCVCVALGVFAMVQPPHPGVTKANFDRVREKATVKEVIAILGNPRMADETTIKPFSSQYWIAPNGRIVTVSFAHGAVAEKEWLGDDETIPAKLRRWLRLPASD